MFLAFTHMPGESCCRWFGRSILFSCDSFSVLVNSLCWLILHKCSRPRSHLGYRGLHCLLLNMCPSAVIRLHIFTTRRCVLLQWSGYTFLQPEDVSFCSDQATHFYNQNMCPSAVIRLHIFTTRRCVLLQWSGYTFLQPEDVSFCSDQATHFYKHNMCPSAVIWLHIFITSVTSVRRWKWFTETSQTITVTSQIHCRLY